jgi:hypothetical protein
VNRKHTHNTQAYVKQLRRTRNHKHACQCNIPLPLLHMHLIPFSTLDSTLGVHVILASLSKQHLISWLWCYTLSQVRYHHVLVRVAQFSKYVPRHHGIKMSHLGFLEWSIITPKTELANPMGPLPFDLLNQDAF